MYDLLNEPNNSYLKKRPPPHGGLRPVRPALQGHPQVDPDHAIVMEGLWHWQTLRDPAKCGYRNVVYSLHWYHFGATTTDDDLHEAIQVFQTWNVPVLVGEFNLFGDWRAWKYALEQYDKHHLSWTMWTYKHTAEGSNSWGVYTTIPGKTPPVPNLAGIGRRDPSEVEGVGHLA